MNIYFSHIEYIDSLILHVDGVSCFYCNFVLGDSFDGGLNL